MEEEEDEERGWGGNSLRRKEEKDRREVFRRWRRIRKEELKGGDFSINGVCRRLAEKEKWRQEEGFIWIEVGMEGGERLRTGEKIQGHFGKTITDVWIIQTF
ncbi:hypothetical protein ACH5RR_041236 [Cinchona calisaya]|uniref:Uncharacterized protein n=1 Tax=Cinchona calisaya TaxID=153742 RepID=A0ABD2XW96_9GENT